MGVYEKRGPKVRPPNSRIPFKRTPNKVTRISETLPPPPPYIDLLFCYQKTVSRELYIPFPSARASKVVSRELDPFDFDIRRSELAWHALGDLRTLNPKP